MHFIQLKVFNTNQTNAKLKNIKYTPPLIQDNTVINDEKIKSSISDQIINIIATPISFNLSRIFNNCFEIGHFLDIFKISHVKALCKRSSLK